MPSSEQTWLRETQELEVALEKELATAQTKTRQKGTSKYKKQVWLLQVGVPSFFPLFQCRGRVEGEDHTG